MSRNVRRHPGVYYDVIESAKHLAQDSTEASLRYFDNVESTLLGLADMPGKGARREFSDPRLAGTRSCAVDGFPNHLIFYQPTEQGIFVLAIVHGARDLVAALRA